MNDEQKHALARFIKTAPERICLNVADHIDDIDRNAEFSKEVSLSDITWSAGAEGAVEVDVPYVRADLVAELVEFVRDSNACLDALYCDVADKESAAENDPLVALLLVSSKLLNKLEGKE